MIRSSTQRTTSGSTVIRGNKLAKFDAKTGKISLYEPPTPNSYPYGADKDKDGNIWISQFTQCRMAKFDPKEEVFTEYPALSAYEDSVLPDPARQRRS